LPIGVEQASSVWNSVVCGLHSGTTGLQLQIPHTHCVKFQAIALLVVAQRIQVLQRSLLGSAQIMHNRARSRGGGVVPGQPMPSASAHAVAAATAAPHSLPWNAHVLHFGARTANFIGAPSATVSSSPGGDTGFREHLSRTPAM